MNGDPFVFHEVIDNGGEPISTNEYFGVGKVTEFRSCSWVGSCIRNNDFGCLQGFGNVSIVVVVADATHLCQDGLQI